MSYKDILKRKVKSDKVNVLGPCSAQIYRIFENELNGHVIDTFNNKKILHNCLA